jgi:chromosome segregation ATPase
VSDASDRATLTAKLEQAQQRIAELEYRVRLLRGADETAESLAADLIRATERVAELESELAAATAETCHKPSREREARVMKTERELFMLAAEYEQRERLRQRVAELERERDQLRARVAELEAVIRKASRAALPEPSHCPSALELTGQLLAVGLMLDRGLLPRSTDGK